MSTELLTAEQVAESLGISVDQVKRRTASEKWPHIKFSTKTIRYRPEHIEAIIAAHESTEKPKNVDGNKFGQTSRSKAKSA